MRYLRRSAVLTAIVAATLTSVPAHAAPPVQVFKDGQAQPVFNAADVIREEVWVTAPVDSDGDGKDDLVHARVIRPKATQDGLKSPVVYTISPYYAGGNDVANHNVDVELYEPPTWGDSRLNPGKDERRAAALQQQQQARAAAESQDEYLLSRGFAIVKADSLGTGPSTGCPTTGEQNETIGGRSIVDWLNGRASAKDAQGNAVQAGWTTGKVGMIGVSYNGTLPNAVASTGVKGLEAIVPIAAISNWYDYYRANGAVVAPGGYQGEDADVLAEYVHTRADRQVCRAVIDKITKDQDRVTGDYTDFWDSRNYLNDVGKVKAATLVVHGLNDSNVKTQQAAQWYAALRKQGTPHKIWWHQFGHTDPIGLRRDAWLVELNRWFTRYLCGQQNGVEGEPRSTVQREDKSWVTEAEWPAPGTAPVSFFPKPGGETTGPLDRTPVRGWDTTESLTDDATLTAQQLADAAKSGNRLSYFTPALSDSLRVSGTPSVTASLSFSRPAANVTALLVDRAPDGTNRIITRGWTDPQNRHGADHTDAIESGWYYQITVPLQPHDYVVAKGHRIGLVLLSSDRDFTLRPKPGAGISVDLARTSFQLPVVGGKRTVDKVVPR
ncbi:Xaa-Pro dipeptidyl-peptidase [Pseudonocardiaceae bacterium YIM PH 21723]|nr:Xaa-Pro dipeptidyl-peptidase [Pseudonocardiaceae bacterium YIM PH 21723]